MPNFFLLNSISSLPNMFISSGPKSDAYRQDDGKENTKFKGVTINKKSSKFKNFESIKEIIFEGKEIKLLPFELFVRIRLGGQYTIDL